MRWDEEGGERGERNKGKRKGKGEERCKRGWGEKGGERRKKGGDRGNF